MSVVSYRVSDLDGKSKVDGPSTFIAFNDEAATIDLSDKESKELRELLAKYFDKGVTVAAKAPKANGNGTATSDLLTGNAKLATVEEIREWAKGKGFEVAAKGRLSGEVLKAFNAHVNEDPTSVDIDS